MSNGGPPNKWYKFNSDGLTSDQILARLNSLAEHDIYSVAVSVVSVDGTWVYVGGYGK